MHVKVEHKWKLDPIKRLSDTMNVSSIVCLLLLIIVMLLTKCTARSKLSLWIDETQLKSIAGYHMDLYIITQGNVLSYLDTPDFDRSLPVLPADIDTVNLTWEAGDEYYAYWFDNLKSKNKSILYNPLLSIPASGVIPKGPKIFQITISCTGDDEGKAHMVLGLHITDRNRVPINGSPIKLRLRKQCFQFEATDLCKEPCENGGRCNGLGECECTQGYHGQYCEKDMCNPKCEHNGTCISPDMCLCLDGFFGTRCEKAMCKKPCQNGGRCVSSTSVQSGVCWCNSGFYGVACEFSYCQKPCKHGGLCIGVNKCDCKRGYSGDQCEKGIDRKKRRTQQQRQKIAKKCDRLKRDIEKRCERTKVCKSKQTRIAKKCTSHKHKTQKRCKKRQGLLAGRCIKQREKRRKRCQHKKARYDKECSITNTERKKKRRP